MAKRNAPASEPTTITVYPTSPFDPGWQRRRYSFTICYVPNGIPANWREIVADQADVERLNSLADIVQLMCDGEKVPTN
ncbi:MAG: hypothetical protein ABFE01_12310, partial [Phycisphaerales bacterium]